MDWIFLLWHGCVSDDRSAAHGTSNNGRPSLAPENVSAHNKHSHEAVKILVEWKMKEAHERF